MKRYSDEIGKRYSDEIGELIDSEDLDELYESEYSDHDDIEEAKKIITKI